MAYYIDSSAFLKLVLTESDSDPMRSWVEGNEHELVASELLRVEAMRATRKHSADLVLPARELLSTVSLVAVSSEICERAAGLGPTVMRSLDAIHLATALLADVNGVLTYDQRLADACAGYGLKVIAPGVA